MGLSQTGVPQKVCNKPTNPYYLVGIQHLVAMAPKQPRADDREFLATVNALEGFPTKRIQHKPIYWYVLDVFFCKYDYADRSFSRPKTGPNQKSREVESRIAVEEIWLYNIQNMQARWQKYV